MSDVQRQQADYLRQRRDGDREQRFKIHRNIPKITAEGAVSLLEEFDAFEETFGRTNPQSGKEWAMTLDDALEGQAKTWRN
jgi:ERCC4-type nuclease